MNLTTAQFLAHISARLQNLDEERRTIRRSAVLAATHLADLSTKDRQRIREQMFLDLQDDASDAHLLRRLTRMIEEASR